MATKKIVLPINTYNKTLVIDGEKKKIKFGEDFNDEYRTDLQGNKIDGRSNYDFDNGVINHFKVLINGQSFWIGMKSWTDKGVFYYYSTYKGIDTKPSHKAIAELIIKTENLIV